jgi:hypothetical protein
MGEKKEAHFGGHYIFLKRLPTATLHLVKHPTTTIKKEAAMSLPMLGGYLVWPIRTASFGFG